jgi:parallel beta-helix repeat protein
MTVMRKAIIGFVLALAIGNSAGVVLGETFKECQVPQDYKTIQTAIDDETCDTVAVTPGTYKENLKIERSLKITGIDRENVTILGKELGYPVILIQGSQDVSVTIEGLSLVEAKADETKYDGCADWPICPAGMVIRGEVGVTIQGAKITGNASDGIFLLDSVKAAISNTIISGNAVGCSPGWICMGIDVADSAQATISETSVADNELAGIWVRRSAQARILNSQISGNGLDGISLSDRGTAEIRGNRIFNNIRCGVHVVAWEWDLEVRVTGERNEIFGNKEGDLCPSDFAWPASFIKPPSIELTPNEPLIGQKIGPKALTEAPKDQYYISVAPEAKLLAHKFFMKPS